MNTNHTVSEALQETAELARAWERLPFSERLSLTLEALEYEFPDLDCCAREALADQICRS